MARFSVVYEQLPESIKNLIQYSIKLMEPQKIILFGSRARGDHRSDSDYDICFFDIKDANLWTRFSVEIEDKNITLLKTDLVLFDQMNEEYQSNIIKDGVLIYER